MPTLTISAVETSGDVVAEALFQTNIVRSANTGTPWFADDTDNPVGTPTDLAHQAVTHFGISIIRYPGGAADASFADGMMIDGALPDHVVNILTYAQANGLTVDMVVPVDTLPGMERAAFLAQMADFAAAVELQFPGIVTSYELGNEYWNYREALDGSLEAAYGQNAAEVAVALDLGMAMSGADADVFVQASGNLRGAFDNNSDLANGAIQDAFATVDGAMDVLDGVIRNSYWRDADLDGFENDSGPFAEDRGLDFNLTGTLNAWSDWLGRNVLAMVGEYNLNRNIGTVEDGIDMGVHGASYLLEHLSNMIDAGVDIAFAWPIAHNTQNAFIYRDEDISTVTVHGLEIATNTTRAAILDLMRQTVVSHELVHAGWDFGPVSSDVEVTLFQNIAGQPGQEQGERIVFLSSRSDVAQSFTADLSLFAGDYLSVTAIAIHYEQDGNHMRDAIVREVAVSDPEGDAIFDVALQPYEVVQFRFVYTDGTTTGTPPDNGTPAPSPDPVDPLPVPDTDPSHPCGVTDGPAVQKAATTTQTGDVGDDILIGGSGQDAIYGQGGDDTLLGNAGDDYLHGGPGWDLLSGGSGADLIVAGSGNDTLDGGVGHDRLVGGLGADVFVFAAMHGHDIVVDFDAAGGDRIDLSGLDLSLADLRLGDPASGLALHNGLDLVIATSADSSMILSGVLLSDLTADHFIF